MPSSRPPPGIYGGTTGPVCTFLPAKEQRDIYVVILYNFGYLREEQRFLVNAVVPACVGKRLGWLVVLPEVSSAIATRRYHSIVRFAPAKVSPFGLAPLVITVSKVPSNARTSSEERASADCERSRLPYPRLGWDFLLIFTYVSDDA